MRKYLAKIIQALRKNSGAYELTVKDNVNDEIIIHRLNSLKECQIVVRKLEAKAFCKLGDYTVKVSMVNEGIVDKGDVENNGINV